MRWAAAMETLQIYRSGSFRKWLLFTPIRITKTPYSWDFQHTLKPANIDALLQQGYRSEQLKLFSIFCINFYT